MQGSLGCPYWSSLHYNDFLLITYDFLLWQMLPLSLPFLNCRELEWNGDLFQGSAYLGSSHGSSHGHWIGNCQTGQFVVHNLFMGIIILCGWCIRAFYFSSLVFHLVTAFGFHTEGVPPHIFSTIPSTWPFFYGSKWVFFCPCFMRNNILLGIFNFL